MDKIHKMKINHKLCITPQGGNSCIGCMTMYFLYGDITTVQVESTPRSQYTRFNSSLNIGI